MSSIFKWFGDGNVTKRRQGERKITKSFLLPINCNGNLEEKKEECMKSEVRKFSVRRTRLRIDAVQAIQSEATQKSQRRADNFQLRIN